MRILPILGFVLALCSVAFAGKPAVLVDIPRIAGQNETYVAKVLGKPLRSKKSKDGQERIYKNPSGGEVEIVFINGRADWITVTPDGKTPVRFDREALQVLGLRPTPPFFEGPAVIRWKGIGGLLEVMIFPAGQNVDYLYVKARTP